MGHEHFKGWFNRQLQLPDGDRMICYLEKNACSNVNLYDFNHNIFRLNAQDQVIWQVQRHEQGKLNWDAMHAQAHTDGFDGYRQLLIGFMLTSPDGRHNINPTTGEPPQIARWEPGCIIKLTTTNGQSYQLDPYTGIAINTALH